MSDTTPLLDRGEVLAAVRPARWAAWRAVPVPLLVLLASLVALRFWVVGNLGFDGDEPYYWLWSRHLAVGYFDQPPMIAYLVWFGTALVGDSALGIRVLAIVLMVLATALLYALALSLFNNRRVGLLTVLWFSVTPPAAVFSVIMSPDTPAMLFWIASCVALALVWRTGRGEWWYVAGATVGLLMLSKYTGVFLIAGIAAWLWLSAEMRPWLKRHEPYVAGAIALILFSPVIWWNAQHGWASFVLQFGRALHSGPEGGLFNVADFILVQATFVSPLILAFIVGGLAVALTRGLRRQQANWLLLGLTSAPMLLYFLIHALSEEVYPQWPSAAYPAGMLAAIAAFSARADAAASPPLLQRGFRVAPWLGLVMTLMLLVQMTLAPLPVAVASDPFARFAGWPRLAADTRAVARAQGASYLLTDDYGLNSQLAFYQRDIATYQAGEAIRYVSMPPLDQALLGRAVGLYVESDPKQLARVEQRFDEVVWVATVSRRRRDGDAVEAYRLYRLKGYRGGLPY